MFVQAKAGHEQGSTTERYLHAAKTSFPDMAELAEARAHPGTPLAPPHFPASFGHIRSDADGSTAWVPS